MFLLWYKCISQRSASTYYYSNFFFIISNNFKIHAFSLSEIQLPIEVPVSIPCHLVAQRPDVKAAEAQLHAASAQIGVQTANLLPQFTITGSYGGSSNFLSQLFSGDLSSVEFFFLLFVFSNVLLQKRWINVWYLRSKTKHNICILNEI